MTTIENLRSWKINNIVVFDTVTVIICSTLFSVIYNSYYTKHDLSSKKFIFNTIYTLIIFFIIGIITHYLLGIPTGLNHKLGLSENPRNKK